MSLRAAPDAELRRQNLSKEPLGKANDASGDSRSPFLLKDQVGLMLI